MIGAYLYVYLTSFYAMSHFVYFFLFWYISITITKNIPPGKRNRLVTGNCLLLIGCCNQPSHLQFNLPVGHRATEKFTVSGFAVHQ